MLSFSDDQHILALYFTQVCISLHSKLLVMKGFYNILWIKLNNWSSLASIFNYLISHIVWKSYNKNCYLYLSRIPHILFISNTMNRFANKKMILCLVFCLGVRSVGGKNEPLGRRGGQRDLLFGYRIASEILKHTLVESRPTWPIRSH